MTSNKNLHNAKKNGNDEFYTQIGDIENELHHYWPHFKGKTVICNCDDPYESNFALYFLSQFNFLGLKRLICTCYGQSKMAGRQLSLFEDYDKPVTNDEAKKRKAYYLDVSIDDFQPYLDRRAKGEDDPIGRCDLRTKEYTKFIKEHTKRLKGDGDFRSEECIELLKQADIVVTNPPFSLFREYVAQLVEYDKKFVIWGDINAITYKDFFPLLKEGKVWTGYHCNTTCHFEIPDSYEKWDEKYTAKMNDGHKYGTVPRITVYTNLDIPKKHEPFTTYYKYDPKKYPKYDNYDAINVDHTNEIPCDYDGVIGIPITGLGKIALEQFEIIGLFKDTREGDYMIVGKPTYIDEGHKNFVGPCIDGVAKYARVLIRWKQLPDME